MKKCPYCAEEIQDEAVVCKHCGRNLATGAPASPTVVVQSSPQRLWSPGVAAVLSLIIPGAGQMYKGQVGIGIFWLIATVIGYMAFLVPGIILHIACILTAASGNPYPHTGATVNTSGTASTGRSMAAPTKGHYGCPHCSKTVRAHDTVCPHCGHALIAQT